MVWFFIWWGIDKFNFWVYSNENKTIKFYFEFLVIFYNLIEYNVLMENDKINKGRKIMGVEELKMHARDYVSGIIAELVGIDEKEGE